MLSIYRRHRENCKHASDRISNLCRCPVWATGTLDGKAYRKSLKTRSFDRAQQLVRKIENGPEPKEELKCITITDALGAFINDCESRNLNPSTLRKYKLLAARLRDFAAIHGLRDVAELTRERRVAFRGTWKGSPRTLTKTLERARAIGRFAFENGWIARNPFKGIKAPQVKTLPRLPFAEKEIETIIAHAKDDRELAFILTLRHTGLRIGDASLLRVSQFSENRIHLYTSKAGTPVSIVIPAKLTSVLKAIPPRAGYFFVRGESTSMHTTADLWRRRIKILCKEAKVFPDHPHRFRHSLAADLLTKGASVEDVAAILGNSPAIVARHYSQWIKTRQDRLDSIVQQTWNTALVRVK